MKISIHPRTSVLLFIFFALGFISASCKGDDPVMPKNELDIPRIEDVLNGNDENLINLLNKVRGSVGKRNSGSKTIWSRKNDYGLGLYISANHVFNVTGWNSRNARFLDLYAENLGIFESSQLPPVNGDIALGKTLIADFPLMHSDISPDATNTTILPAEDFFLGIVDNQRIEQPPLPRYPDVIRTDEPLQLYDPANRTTADQTWNDPVAGEMAIGIGYPQDSDIYPNGAATYGKVLSDTEAADVIARLKSAGDIEGDIPYDSTAEFFLAAPGTAGMSGGGVFNSAGQLLGIMVRASDQPEAPKILRVVKVSYIRSKIVELFDRLPQTTKDKVKPFIRGEL